MNLSPYAKTVVSAVGTLVAIVIQYLVGDGADAATLGTAIIGLLTTLGVFKVTNAPLADKGSAIEPSPHTSISLPVESVPMTVQNIVPIKPKPRKPRPTSKPVRVTIKPAKKRATTKKDGE